MLDLKRLPLLVRSVSAESRVDGTRRRTDVRTPGSGVFGAQRDGMQCGRRGSRDAQSKDKSELPDANRASACSAAAGQAHMQRAACSLDDVSKLRRANLQRYMAGPTAEICISAFRIGCDLAWPRLPHLHLTNAEQSAPNSSARRSRKGRVGSGVKRTRSRRFPVGCVAVLHRGDFRKRAPTPTRFAMSTGSPLRSVDPFQRARPGHIPQQPR